MRCLFIWDSRFSPLDFPAFLSFSLFYHLCCSFPSGKGNSRTDHVAWVREDCVNWMKGHRCTISPKPIPMCNRIQFPLNETVYGLRCLRLPPCLQSISAILSLSVRWQMTAAKKGPLFRPWYDNDEDYGWWNADRREGGGRERECIVIAHFIGIGHHLRIN